jgi:hypothetical protein
MAMTKKEEKIVKSWAVKRSIIKKRTKSVRRKRRVEVVVEIKLVKKEETSKSKGSQGKYKFNRDKD